MGFVVEDKCKRVFENGHSLIETDIVFSKIALGFGGVLLESHGYILLQFKIAETVKDAKVKSKGAREGREGPHPDWRG